MSVARALFYLAIVFYVTAIILVITHVLFLSGPFFIAGFVTWATAVVIRRSSGIARRPR
jgi:hypothetical protein